MSARSILVVVILLWSSVGVAEPWDVLPPKERDAWQRLIGLEAGIALMHCVQPISAAAGEMEWRPKHAVAVAGCILYGGNTVGIAYRQNWALWVNIVGPIVGIVTVGTGWALNATGVIAAEVRPDAAQLVGGLLQTWAWIESFRLLSLQRKRQSPAVAVGPSGLVLSWTW